MSTCAFKSYYLAKNISVTGRNNKIVHTWNQNDGAVDGYQYRMRL